MDVHPETIKRRCGGWLAVSPVGQPLRIGVTAETEEEAVEEFCRSFSRWMELLDRPLPHNHPLHDRMEE